MIIENRETGLDKSGALSARGKSFRGMEVGDSHGKDGPGGNQTRFWERRDSIQINKALGVLGKQKSQVRFRLGSVHAELDEIIFKVISSKFGSGRFSVTINEIGTNGGGITGVRMFADDKKPIRGEDSLFKDAEEKLLLFMEEGNLIRGTGYVAEVDHVVDIVTARGDLEVTLPGDKEPIFLERFAIRNAALDTLEELQNR
jgi:hypothetical protein